MSNDLRSLIAGFQISQALYVLATLRIPDLLAEGPRTADDLADAVGSDRDALRRLLRAVAGSGVVTALDDGAFALTELGSTLRTDVPGSMHAFAAYVGRPYHWNAWAELLGSVHTGQPAFRRLHGKTAWEYRAEHPEESELFDDWMTAQTTFVDVAVLEGYDFGQFQHLVDVGGGRGAFLRAFLARHPGARATLFDQAHVVAGVDDLETVAGSFFDVVPSGGDAYVLKSIIHDWDDDAAVSILRACRAALVDDARLLLIERDLDRDPVAPWMDIQMLVMLGGRERTEQEYAGLLRAAGLEYVGSVGAGAGFCVFEARA